MKRWISVLLAVVVVAAVCIFLVARRNASQEPQDTEKQTEATQKEQDDGSFCGLQIGLPEDYRMLETTQTSALYSNDAYTVRIVYRANAGEETAETVWEERKAEFNARFEDMQFLQYGSGVTQETPYVYGIYMEETGAKVVAIYATQASIWLVEMENLQGKPYELDPMILQITGWECEDPQ